MGTFDTGDTFNGKTFTGYASEGFTKTGGVTRIKSGKKGSPGKVIYKKGSSSTNKEAPETIQTATGETVTVTKKETPSYPGVRLAQEYKADLTTEQANRIAQQQGNRRYIAVSSEDVNKINQDFKAEGYNAKKLIEGMNSGTVTFNKDQEGNINLTTKETITTETSTGTGSVPAPKEAVEYLNKNYFGVTDYFKDLTAQGIKETGTGAYNIYKQQGNNKNNIFLLASGKVKTGLGFSGTVASSVIEPIVYAVSQKRRYDKGIPEAELQSGIYKPIIAKETEQTKAGVLQISLLTQGIKINPSEATPIKTFTKLETSPYELPRSLTIEEATGEKFIIKKGLQPEAPGMNKLASGLIETSERQTQIYPKALVEKESIFAPQDLPSARELENVFGKKYQSSFGIATEKAVTVSPEEVFKVFRSENPPIKQTGIKEYITATSKKAPAPFPEEIVIIEEGTKKGIIFNKKAQSTINPFGELEIDKGGVYEVYKGGENNKFIFEPGNLGIEATGSKSFMFIPVATRSVYNFKTGDKSITGTINSARIEFKTINDISPAIRTETETDQGQGSGIRTRTRTNTQSAQRQITEQTQEQQQDQIIFNPIKVTTNPYKPKSPEPKEPATPPDIYKRFKQDNKNKTPTINGFNVLVKSKGIFNKINNKPLDLKSALKKGSETVERTPSATFKITNPENPGGIFTSSTPKGFYKKGNLFIEETRRRINTPGELFGITSKGRTSKRIKKLYGG